MMSGRFLLPLGHSPELEVRILEIPFTQRRISLFIFLPDEPGEDGLRRLESNMTSENVKKLFSTLQVTYRGTQFQELQQAQHHVILHFLRVCVCVCPG